jgi:hypothetical protein
MPAIDANVVKQRKSDAKPLGRRLATPHNSKRLVSTMQTCADTQPTVPTFHLGAGWVHAVGGKHSDASIG